MMSLWKRARTRYFLWLEGIKGTNKISESVIIQTGKANHLKVIHHSGYEINIYCQRREYLKEYSRSFVRNQTYSTYFVFARASDDAPELIKMACQLEVTFPPLVPEHIDDEIHKRAAIDAYIDLIKDQLVKMKAMQ